MVVVVIVCALVGFAATLAWSWDLTDRAYSAPRRRTLFANPIDGLAFRTLRFRNGSTTPSLHAAPPAPFGPQVLDSVTLQ